MSTSDLTVTLVGWVGTEPKHYTGTGVTPFTSFRMANTRRYFDRAQSAWTDGRTEWFTVKVWRQSAVNVASSLRKGDPVLVHGRLATEQWDGPEGQRTSLVLEALAIGPDLTYGRAAFARTVHIAGAAGAGSDVPGDVDQSAGPAQDGGGSSDAVADDAFGPDDPWATDAVGVPGLASAVVAGTEDADAGDAGGPDAGHGEETDVRADEVPDDVPAAGASVGTRGRRGRAVEAAAV